MDIKAKVVEALVDALKPEYVRLENDDGISGFVVSRRFEGMSTLDRQVQIDEALARAAMTPEQRRQVLMIAAVTPREYDSVGVPIRVHRVKEIAGGAIKLVLHGGTSDADYVRGVLNKQEGVATTEPRPVSGARGVLVAFRARGTKAHPLTKAKAISVLKKDRYIKVLPTA